MSILSRQEGGRKSRDGPVTVFHVLPHQCGNTERHFSKSEWKWNHNFLLLADRSDCSHAFLFVIVFIEGFNNDDVRLCVRRDTHQLRGNLIFFPLLSFSRSDFASFFFQQFEFYFFFVFEAFIWRKYQTITVTM